MKHLVSVNPEERIDPGPLQKCDCASTNAGYSCWADCYNNTSGPSPYCNIQCWSMIGNNCGSGCYSWSEWIPCPTGEYY